MTEPGVIATAEYHRLYRYSNDSRALGIPAVSH